MTTSSRIISFKNLGDGQVASGSESLPDPVTLEVEDHMLEREQNEEVLEVLGVTRTTSVTLVETHDVSVVVNKKTLKGRFY
jgi:hypothetical protein